MPSDQPDAGSDSFASWPDQATDLIVSTVGAVRDRTVGTAMTVARAIVYGFFSILVGTTALVLTCILIVRVATVYLPGERVWIPELGLGLILGAIALLLWSKASKIPHR